MFEEFYLSYWQHPVLLWVAPVVFFFFIPKGAGSIESRFFSRYLTVFTLLTILDPLVTGPLLSLAQLPDELASKIGIVFVILGDLRFFAVIEHFSQAHEKVGSWRGWAAAFGWSLLVPVLQLSLIELLPEFFAKSRHTYLAYEVLFFVLALVMRFFVLPRRVMSVAARSWLNAVCVMALLYYGLWASADMVILAGFDAGFGLRVVPNQLYYSFFLPFVWWRAPAVLKWGEPRSFDGGQHDLAR